MKKTVFSILRLLPFVGIALIPAAELSAHEGSHEFSIPIERIGHVKTIEAISLYGQLSAYHPEAEEHFREALLRRGDVEAYIRKSLEELPLDPLNGRDRNFHFRIMAALRTPWAARICGEYLLSNEKVPIPEFKTEEEAKDFFFEQGATTKSNSSYALDALEKMNIATAPTKYGMPRPSGKGIRELWRAWWRENEANIEELMAHGETPDADGKDDPASAVGSADVKRPDKRRPEVRAAQPSANEPSGTKPGLQRWLWIAGIALSLLSVAGWFYFRWRRK